MAFSRRSGARVRGCGQAGWEISPTWLAQTLQGKWVPGWTLDKSAPGAMVRWLGAPLLCEACSTRLTARNGLPVCCLTLFWGGR